MSLSVSSLFTPLPPAFFARPAEVVAPELIGCLLLILPDCAPRELASRISLIEALAGMSASAIENQRLLEEQKQLLEAFIELIAGAIDAKSPYTGGHCQRVPALTLMLARAAAASQAPEFIGYDPTEDQWEELHIAAWLHDCGKVTTPEYVVDKATKLETLNDRIHEIRTRFEVVKRDAWIAYWQGVAQGESPQQLAEVRDATLAALDDDFAFVARSNLGGEAMADADLQRLHGIAQRIQNRANLVIHLIRQRHHIEGRQPQILGKGPGLMPEQFRLDQRGRDRLRDPACPASFSAR